MTGLSRDGGLFLPESIPCVSSRLAEWAELPYVELAERVMQPFVDLSAGDLRRLVTASYSGFAHPSVTPVVRVGDIHVMELFHGPTLAVQRFALQFLGNLFRIFCLPSGRQSEHSGATSGDTGSAAIMALRGNANSGFL